jgi:hypothetical protein
MAEVTRESIIEAAKCVAAQSDGPISRTDFERLSGISQYFIYRLFPLGGWSEVKQLAGLDRHPQDREPLSDDELLTEYHRVASECQRVPTWAIFASRASVSAETIGKRFGGFQGTIKRYRDWLEQNIPDSPMLEQLQVKSKHEVPIPPVSGETVSVKPMVWNKNDSCQFGPPINFRGLRHAPINEQGVVFLFGMVSYELGFIVEAIHAAYPDCEAKRCINTKSQRWQRVRIEFEFFSSNFRDHAHDPNLCDVIVCWEDDWPECPLEVVELRRVIDQLSG